MIHTRCFQMFGSQPSHTHTPTHKFEGQASGHACPSSGLLEGAGTRPRVQRRPARSSHDAPFLPYLLCIILIEQHTLVLRVLSRALAGSPANWATIKTSAKPWVARLAHPARPHCDSKCPISLAGRLESSLARILLSTINSSRSMRWL